MVSCSQSSKGICLAASIKEAPNWNQDQDWYRASLPSFSVFILYIPGGHNKSMKFLDKCFGCIIAFLYFWEDWRFCHPVHVRFARSRTSAICRADKLSPHLYRNRCTCVSLYLRDTRTLLRGKKRVNTLCECPKPPAHLSFELCFVCQHFALPLNASPFVLMVQCCSFGFGLGFPSGVGQSSNLRIRFEFPRAS